jgi:hypothetical protein
MNIPSQLISASFIPIAYGEKACKVSGWQKPENQLDYAALTQYSQPTNYGVVAGTSKLCLIDVDKPDHPKLKELEAFLPETFTVTTGKGLHYYYSYTEPNKWNKDTLSFRDENKNELLGIRIGSSYVIGPNSKHPDGRDYVVSVDVPIATITNTQLDGIVEALGENKDTKTITGSVLVVPSVIVTTPADTSKMDEPDKTIYTYNIYNVLDYFGISPIHGSTNGNNWTVKDNIATCWRCNIHFGPLELFALLSSKCDCDKAESHCRGRDYITTKKMFLSVFADCKPKKEYAPLEKWSSYVIKPKEDRANLLNNYFLERRATIGIVGETGAGKSVIASQIVNHLSVGKSCLGLEGNGTLRTLYLQCEDSEQDCAWERDGAQQFFTDAEKKLVENNSYIKRLVGCIGNDFIDALDYYCEASRPDVVCINPILKFFGGDPISTPDVNMFCGRMDKIIEKWDCGMIWMCHPAKPRSDARKPIDAEYSIFGSQAWGAHVRDTILLRKTGENNDPFLFRAGKRASQLGWKEKYIVRGSDFTKPYWYEASDDVVEKIQAKREAKKFPIYATLQHIPFHPDYITINRLELVSGIPRATLQIQLKELEYKMKAVEHFTTPGSRAYQYYRPIDATE